MPLEHEAPHEVVRPLLTVDELVDAAHESRAVVLSALADLERLGFMERLDDGAYRPTPLAFDVFGTDLEELEPANEIPA